MRIFRPLNFIPYNKNEAIAELESRIGYKRYPRKHGESIFTPKDYCVPNVSDKIVRVIQSYVDFVNRSVWKRY